MKRKDIQDLKIRSEAELSRFIAESREKLRALRFDLAAGKVKNAKALRETKAAIARAETFIREKAALNAKS
jgi:ribosomal protein L29